MLAYCILALNPVHEKIDEAGLAFGRDGNPLGELPPLFEASAATGCRGVLRDENGVAAHGRLATVVRRARRRKSVTDARKQKMAMSNGYLANGKTILCRTEDAGRFRALADIDRPDVRVMVNPGGLNEAFARAGLPHAKLLVHGRNEEIPSLVADGRADVMVTEIVEAPWYVRSNPRLAAPLLSKPFTKGEIGVLMRKGQDDLLAFVNDVLARMAADGTLAALKAKHGL